MSLHAMAGSTPLLVSVSGKFTSKHKLTDFVYILCGCVQWKG